jgi:exopolysaccharide biosynthesis polyprenyl glycosylphosphotransferase
MAHGTLHNWAPEIGPAAKAGMSGHGQPAAASPAAARTAVTVAADALGLGLAAFVAGALVSLLAGAPGIRRLFLAFPSDGLSDILFFVTLIPYWLFVLYLFGLYKAPASALRGSSIDDFTAGVIALSIGSWLLALVLLFVEGLAAPLASLAVFWALACLIVPLLRWGARATVWRRRAFGERVLIVGAGAVGHTVAAKIAKHPQYRIKLLGFLDSGEPMPNGAGPEVPVLGGLDDLEAILEGSQVNRVILAFSQAGHEEYLAVARICAEHAVRVNIVPRLFEVLSSRAGVDDLEGIPLLDVAQVELSQLNMLIKRAFDLLIGGLITLVCLPLLGLIALAIKLDSRGPVFYRQERMGRNGKVFRVLKFKFRSMVVGAEQLREQLAEQNEYSGPMFKIKEDPRVTRVGAWLRRTSLDELPQLFNVLRGDMSLVGPRPLWVEEAAQCRGWTKKRLHITPGMTGLWQVMGRSDIPFDEMVKLDYFYVTGWSLGWDIRLLFETVPAVLGRRGAY